ncbi:hypothetical protein [Actinomyces bowdenii]|uniref:hypothetical protein n=1 Tax=Actinomyces bowdenii TaxID=131109 RepID=UPI001FB9D6C3|nr:hypothetical protein [Actinomyces bowdenii]
MTIAARMTAAGPPTGSTAGATTGTGGPSPSRRLARLGLSALGAARAALDASTLLARPMPALERVNFHGRTVSLRGGVGAAAGSIAAAALCAPWPRRARTAHAAEAAERAELGAAALAALVAATAGAGAGLADDLDAGAHDGQEVAKGLAGHLRALRRGRVTTGVLKIAVIGAGAAVAGALLSGSRAASAGAMPSGGLGCLGGHAVPTSLTTALTAARRHRPGAPARLADAAGSAVVVASWANVINLLDLRPGRALKAAGAGAALLLAAPGRPQATRRLAAGALGTVAAALPEDLGEETMLGDTGANALGALLGTALAAHPSRALRLGAGAAGVALILASERVSFSRVIERTPVLAALDALGRRSAPGRPVPGSPAPATPVAAACADPVPGTGEPGAPATGLPGATTPGAG